MHRSRPAGVFVDLDTIFLRDARMLFMPAFAAFGVRNAFNIYVSGSVLRLKPRPDAVTAAAVASVLKEVGDRCGGRRQDKRNRQ